MDIVTTVRDDDTKRFVKLGEASKEILQRLGMSLSKEAILDSAREAKFVLQVQGQVYVYIDAYVEHLTTHLTSPPAINGEGKQRTRRAVAQRYRKLNLLIMRKLFDSLEESAPDSIEKTKFINSLLTDIKQTKDIANLQPVDSSGKILQFEEKDLKIHLRSFFKERCVASNAPIWMLEISNVKRQSLCLKNQSIN